MPHGGASNYGGAFPMNVRDEDGVASEPAPRYLPLEKNILFQAS
jgi:hypothetical protein